MVYYQFMERVIDYTIDEQNNGLSIERYLLARGYTRQNIVDLKKINRSILINDEWMHMNDILHAGDVLNVHIVEDTNSEHIPPVELPFPIVYEDEDIVVVDKPAGMPIHPSLNNYDNTLGNAAAYYYQSRGEKFIYRCVNRLDRDTSGLTIIAKHMVAAGNLYNQMTERRIHREYIAIVEDSGKENMTLPEEMTIDYPIGRRDGSTIVRMVDYENGEMAITHLRVLEKKNNLALVSLHLDTGRTHQIRVHMSYIGHPLVGDWLYNPDNKAMGRQALHSARLEFMHPVSGKLITISSNLPEDMLLLWGEGDD